MNPQVREVVREARCMYLSREQTFKFAARVLPAVAQQEVATELDEFILEQTNINKETLDA